MRGPLEDEERSMLSGFVAQLLPPRFSLSHYSPLAALRSIPRMR
jgi:hypothetical protein